MADGINTFKITFEGGQDDEHNPRTLPLNVGQQCYDIDLRKGRFESRKTASRIALLSNLQSSLTFHEPCQLITVLPRAGSGGECLLFATAEGDPDTGGRLKIAEGFYFENEPDGGEPYPRYSYLSTVQDRESHYDAWIQQDEPMEYARFGDLIYIANAHAATEQHPTLAFKTYEIDLKDFKGQPVGWPICRRICNYMGYPVLGDIMATNYGPRYILASSLPLYADPTPDFTASDNVDEVPGDPDDRVMKLVYFRDSLYVFLKRSVWVYSGAPTHWAREQILDVGTLAPETVQVLGPYIYFLGHDGVPRRTDGTPRMAEKLGAFTYDGKLKHIDGRCPVESSLRDHFLKASGMPNTKSWQTTSDFGSVNCDSMPLGSTEAIEDSVQLTKSGVGIVSNPLGSLVVTIPDEDGDKLGQPFYVVNTGFETWQYGLLMRRVAVQCQHTMGVTESCIITAQVVGFTEGTSTPDYDTVLATATYRVNGSDSTPFEAEFLFDDAVIEPDDSTWPNPQRLCIRLFAAGSGLGHVQAEYGAIIDPTKLSSLQHPDILPGNALHMPHPGGSTYHEGIEFAYYTYALGMHSLKAAKKLTLPTGVDDDRWLMVSYRATEEDDTSVGFYIVPWDEDGNPGELVEVPITPDPYPIMGLVPAGTLSISWQATLRRTSTHIHTTPVLHGVYIHYLTDVSGHDSPTADVWDDRYLLHLRRRDEDVRDTYVWDREAWSVWCNTGAMRSDVMYDTKARPRLIFADITDVGDGDCRMLTLFEDGYSTTRPADPKWLSGKIPIADTWVGQVADVTVEYTEISGKPGTLYLMFRQDGGQWQNCSIALTGDGKDHVKTWEPAMIDGRVMEVAVGWDYRKSGNVANKQAPVIVDCVTLNVIPLSPRYGTEYVT